MGNLLYCVIINSYRISGFNMEINNKKIFIVVTVYKTEPYLRKCLESLVKQTMQDILIIVVNDESPDNSQEIIEEYVKNYPDKVMSYIKKNGGPGLARNYGIDKAMEIIDHKHLNDVYLSFVDSDDWLEIQAYELLYKEALKDNADIVCADHRFIVNENNIINYMGFWGTNIEEPFQRIFYTNVHTVWNKIYRFSLFENIRYPALVHDDAVTIPLVFRSVKKISYIPVILYNYLKRDDSVTGAGTLFLKPDALRAVNLLLDYSTAHNDEIILQFAMEYYLEVLLLYKGKSLPLNKYYEYETLNNELCKRLSDKDILAFQNAVVKRVRKGFSTDYIRK